MIKWTSIVSGKFWANSTTASAMIFATSILLKPRLPVPMAGMAIDLCLCDAANHKHSYTALEIIYNIGKERETLCNPSVNFIINSSALCQSLYGLWNTVPS